MFNLQDGPRGDFEKYCLILRDLNLPGHEKIRFNDYNGPIETGPKACWLKRVIQWIKRTLCNQQHPIINAANNIFLFVDENKKYLDLTHLPLLAQLNVVVQKSLKYSSKALRSDLHIRVQHFQFLVDGVREQINLEEQLKTLQQKLKQAEVDKQFALDKLEQAKAYCNQQMTEAETKAAIYMQNKEAEANEIVQTAKSKLAMAQQRLKEALSNQRIANEVLEKAIARSDSEIPRVKKESDAFFKKIKTEADQMVAAAKESMAKALEAAKEQADVEVGKVEATVKRQIELIRNNANAIVEKELTLCNELHARTVTASNQRKANQIAEFEKSMKILENIKKEMEDSIRQKVDASLVNKKTLLMKIEARIELLAKQPIRILCNGGVIIAPAGLLIGLNFRKSVKWKENLAIQAKEADANVDNSSLHFMRTAMKNNFGASVAARDKLDSDAKLSAEIDEKAVGAAAGNLKEQAVFVVTHKLAVKPEAANAANKGILPLDHDLVNVEEHPKVMSENVVMDLREYSFKVVKLYVEAIDNFEEFSKKVAGCDPKVVLDLLTFVRLVGDTTNALNANINKRIKQLLVHDFEFNLKVLLDPSINVLIDPQINSNNPVRTFSCNMLGRNFKKLCLDQRLLGINLNEFRMILEQARATNFVFDQESAEAVLKYAKVHNAITTTLIDDFLNKEGAKSILMMLAKDLMTPQLDKLLHTVFGTEVGARMSLQVANYIKIVQNDPDVTKDKMDPDLLEAARLQYLWENGAKEAFIAAAEGVADPAALKIKIIRGHGPFDDDTVD